MAVRHDHQVAWTARESGMPTGKAMVATGAAMMATVVATMISTIISIPTTTMSSSMGSKNKEVIA